MNAIPHGFVTLHASQAPEVMAPDGARVRVPLALPRGSMALFELERGQASAPVRHRSVEALPVSGRWTPTAL